MSNIIPPSLSGLTSGQARERLMAEGYNELPREKERHFWQLAWNIIQEPMLLLLLACGLIYVVLGDLREALVLLFFVFVIIFITIYQESKTEKALAALKSLASPRALVLRDSHYQRIAGREVVRGDLVFLNEGDRVPADGILIWNNNLAVNESLLTGEALSVQKEAGHQDSDMRRPGEESQICVYSGTMVVSGQGLAFIKAVATATEMGRIGQLLGGIKTENTLLQKDIKRLIKYVSIIGLSFCLAVIAVSFMFSGNLLRSFLSGLTLAMSILPEEFPVVLAIFLSIGAWRMSRRQVLIRKLSAVESLGAATVLCVDKTGTLTMNKMKIKQIWLADDEADSDLNQGALMGRIYDIAPADNSALREILKIAALASHQETFDPLEKAIKELKRQVFLKENIYHGWRHQREYPLSSSLLAETNVWENQDEGWLVASKGAPEAIMELCRLADDQKDDLHAQVKKMAQDGLRVLAVAAAIAPAQDLPESPRSFTFKLVGLLGFMDPVRAHAADAIQECYEAGITVKMITGDYPETGKNIAGQIGLANPEEALTGAELQSLSDKELSRAVKHINVFARMVPENKLQIIRALQKSRHVVVMTGDGVNDGPALKAADIGVAMGSRGTDVAREAADIVLLDDDFSSLVKGIKEGRRIFDNLKRAIVYTLAVHIPIAGLTLIPLILGWPIILFPAHIMFLELIIDPSCSVVFEAEPADLNIMKRRPRNSRQSILNRSNLFISFIQGLSILAVVLAVYKYCLIFGFDDASARTTAFTTLIFANLLLILTNRSWRSNTFIILFRQNKALWPIVGGALLFLALTIYTPFFRGIFSFARLGWEIVLLAFAAALLSLSIFEIMKVFHRTELTD